MASGLSAHVCANAQAVRLAAVADATSVGEEALEVAWEFFEQVLLCV